MNSEALRQLLVMNQSDVWNSLYNLSAIEDYTKHSYLGKYILYKHNSDGIKPLIVCHIDTCNEGYYELTPNDIVISEGIIKLSATSKATCLGGDDRVGVYIALELMKRKVKADFLFTCEEEVGGIGAKSFARDYYSYNFNHSCFIEIDRKGTNHIASYGYDNKELENIIGLPVEMGSYTDIVDICATTGIAGYNIACGYYRQHTKYEYIVIDEVKWCLSYILELIPKLYDKVFYNECKKLSYRYDDYKKVSYSYNEDNRCFWCGEESDFLDEVTGICLECLRTDGKAIEEYYKEGEEYYGEY